MSRFARSHPDDEDLWDAPVVPVADPRRRCWCGTAVTQSSTCGCCCLSHDDLEAAMRRHPAGKAKEKA